MANPASPRLKPWRVKYNVRNGTTNVPNLLRKMPANKIQTGRGNDRSVVPRDSWVGPGGVGLVCIKPQKNPADLSEGRVGKSLTRSGARVKNPGPDVKSRRDARLDPPGGYGENPLARVGTFPDGVSRNRS